MIALFGWRGVSIQLFPQRFLLGIEWNWDLRGAALFLGPLRIQICFPSEAFLDRIREQIMEEEEKRA